MVFSRRSGFDARLGGGRAGFRQFGLLRAPFTPTVSAARSQKCFDEDGPRLGGRFRTDRGIEDDHGVNLNLTRNAGVTGIANP